MRGVAVARHWRLCGGRPRLSLAALSSSRPRNDNSTDRAYCSLEEEGNSRPLTLANLGFRDDGQDVELELSTAPLREAGRPISKKSPSPRIPTSAARTPTPSVHTPSAEEMKQAALEASYILAEIAGMQISRPKKLAAVEATTHGGKEAESLQQKKRGCIPRPKKLATVEATTDGGKEAESLQQKKRGSKEEKIEEEEERHQHHKKCESPFEMMEATEPAQALTLDHPWHEWLEFLSELQTKGFFEGSEQGVDEGKHLFESIAAVRHATNGFGRSHSEMFNCLSRKDLRVLANFGCPDVERKSSNASKRLRAHFRIQEGDVCQCCRLKMTCPRAYFAPESNIRMNTLDVVRIITGYATNAWPNADSYVSYPTEVGTSVCNLLREFLMCKVLPRNPAEDEHVPTERLRRNSEKNAGKKVKCSPPVDLKPGDWNCPNCEFVNFSRNRRCRECGVCRPQQVKNAYIGDWHCPKCRYLNFSKNSHCRECNFERQTKVKWMGGERLPDDHPASDKLLTSKEKKYEASDEEGPSDMSLMSPDGLSESESEDTLSDEEQRALSKGLSNAARNLSRATFKWDEMKENVEALLDLSVTNKTSKVSKRISEHRTGNGRASRRY